MMTGIVICIALVIVFQLGLIVFSLNKLIALLSGENEPKNLLNKAFEYLHPIWAHYAIEHREREEESRRKAKASGVHLSR